MLIGSGLQALATSDKFKPLVLGQIQAAGDTREYGVQKHRLNDHGKRCRGPLALIERPDPNPTTAPPAIVRRLHVRSTCLHDVQPPQNAASDAKTVREE